jgi:hypothetical protein
MFIYTTFTTIKAVIIRTHCSRILLITLSQISLFSHILYFGRIVLTTLEPSTTLKPHYPVPLSLCRWTLARCFAAPQQALSLMSARIGRWWTPESLAILPCLAVTWLPRQPLTASPWHGSAIRWSLAASLYCRFVSLRRLPVRWTPWVDSPFANQPTKGLTAGGD